MSIFPLVIGKRVFLEVEFFFCGWNHWTFGLYFGFRPELHLGPWMVALEED